MLPQYAHTLKGQYKLPPKNKGYVVSHGCYARAALRSKFGISPIKFSLDVDLSHWTAPVNIRNSKSPNIYTAHDLIPLIAPHLCAGSLNTFKSLIQKIVKSADLILTVSDQTKSDLHALFDIPDNKVVNTYQIVPQDTLEKNIFDLEILNQHGLTAGKYLLSLSTIEPKKNINRLIQAHQISGVKMPLVIVGKEGWMLTSDKNNLSQNPFMVDRNLLKAPGTKHLGYVDKNTRQALLKNARATLFPSLYEGFGLPIAESMAAGTPVLTSNFGAMQEVAGDAALLVDPYNINNIAYGIKALAANDALCHKLVKRGQANIKRFASETITKKVLSCYHSVLEKKPARTSKKWAS